MIRSGEAEVDIVMNSKQDHYAPAVGKVVISSGLREGRRGPAGGGEGSRGRRGRGGKRKGHKSQISGQQTKEVPGECSPSHRRVNNVIF